jgi:SAM-dependent methyltransferase
MIRDEYKQQLKETRAGWEGWGSSAARNCDALIRYLDKHKHIKDVLDFGCGTGALGKWLRQNQEAGTLRKDITIHEYDPSVDGKDVIPTRSFDLIVSLDVLEHVEPDDLAETLGWMRDRAPRQYHHIDCNSTEDRLPDGRDVHLIVETPEWWEDQLLSPDHGWITIERHVHDKRKRGRFPRRSCTFIIERQG